MRHCLPLLFAALAAAMPPEVHGQYFFFDTSGDQICGIEDSVWGTDVNVDVYLDTSHGFYGTTASCSTGEPLSMLSYELVFKATSYKGSSWSFGDWTNAVDGFAQAATGRSGDYLWVSYSGGIKPAGRYKLGTLVFTSEPCSYLLLVPGTSSMDHVTGFGSECMGPEQDFTVRLGRDFEDFCGAGYCDAVRETTWGTIKNRYK